MTCSHCAPYVDEVRMLKVSSIVSRRGHLLEPVLGRRAFRGVSVAVGVLLRLTEELYLQFHLPHS